MDGITDSSSLAEWLMDNDFQPVLGYAFTLQEVGSGSSTFVLLPTSRAALFPAIASNPRVIGGSSTKSEPLM